MQSMIQLNPVLPLASPKGDCFAFALIDYSQEHDLHFVCIQQDTGEIWTWANKDLRAQKNITLGRKLEAKAPAAAPLAEGFFLPAWNMRDYPDKTEGWLEFQRVMRADPKYYLAEFLEGR